MNKDLVLKYGAKSFLKDFSKMHSDLLPLAMKLAVLCFVILIVWRLIESFTSTEKKSYPLGEIIIHIFVVAGLFIYITYIFESIYALSNYIADSIFDVGSSIKLFRKFWGTDFEQAKGIKIIFLRVRNLMGIGAGVAAQLAAFVMLLIRKVILIITYSLSSIVIALSLLPTYNLRRIGALLTNFVQVSSWVVIVAVFNKVISFIGTSSEFGSMGYVCIMVVWAVVYMFIPTIARFIFGGFEFSPITVGASLLASAVAKKPFTFKSKDFTESLGGKLTMKAVGKGGGAAKTALGLGHQALQKANMAFSSPGFRVSDNPYKGTGAISSYL